MATIPRALANFSTSLASKIADTGVVSFTLSSVLTRDGSNVPAGTYGITIDEGKSNMEHMIVTIAGTTATIVTRGLSTIDGSSNVAALQFEHRRNASIKMTNHPLLIRLYLALIGTDTLDNKLKYTTNLTFTDDKELVPKKYVDDTAFNGAPDGSDTTKGIYELATDTEALDGTAAGTTTAPLIPSSAQFGTYKSTHTDKSVTYRDTILAGNIVWYDTATDGYKVALATTQAHIDALAAVAYDAGVNGNTNKKVYFPGSKVTGASGLTKGAPVYLSDTGTASATTGTIRKVIGRALSATVWIFNPTVETPTTTPAAYALPRSGSDSKLDPAWIPLDSFAYTAGENITANDAIYLETRKYRYESGVDATHEVFNATWEGQTFLIDATADTAYGAQIYCYKKGTAAVDYTFALRATSAGLPTGANIASGTLTIAETSLSNQLDKAAWYTVTFATPVALTAGATYALIVYSAGNATGDCLTWSSDDSAPTFAGGSRVNSTNSGATWAADTAKDYLFRIITTPFAKKAKADSITTTLPFLGFAAASVSSGASVSVYQKPRSILSGFTNLIPGRKYMLSQSTAGAISLVPLTVGINLGIIKYLGIAKSATELVYDPDMSEDFLGATTSAGASGTAADYCEVLDDATSVAIFSSLNDGAARQDMLATYTKMTRAMSPLALEIRIDDGASTQSVVCTLTWVGNHIALSGSTAHGASATKSMKIFNYR